MLDACKILIADPDRSEVFQLANAFRRNGWNPIAAGDAILTQAIAQKEVPRAIVLSSTLPGEEATTAIKRLRSTVHAVATPVVVISSRGKATREDFMTAGATEYFERPFDQGAVCEAIRRHLDAEVPLALAPAEKIAAPERMEALAASGALDTAPNEQLDFMIRVASVILHVPMAVLSIVDKHRQFFKSQVGIREPWASARETPLSHSFCQWVVAANDDLAVEDARKHPGLRSNLAIRDIGIIAYAGSPVFSKQGPALGSFCAMDSQPRKWEPADLDSLRCFAKMAEAAIIVEKSGHRDMTVNVNAWSTIAFYATRILRQKELTNKPFERELMLEIVEQQTKSIRACSDLEQNRASAVAR
jgi:GAF domain-containing protein